MLSAETLYERGREHARAGRYRAAQGDLRVAGLRTTDIDLSARIRATEAFLESERQDFRAAVGILDDLLTTDGLSDQTRAILHGQLGGVLAQYGRGEEALPHLAIAADGLADEPMRLIAVLFNRGGIWHDRGEMDRATADFGRAAALAEEHGHEWHAAIARTNQAMAALRTGDLIGALDLLDNARPLIEQQSPVMLATLEFTQAEVLLAAGLPDEAADLLRSSATTFGQHRMRAAQADSELLLARTLADHRPHEATAIARRAATRYRRHGSEQFARRAEALSLTIALAAGTAHAGRVRAARQLLPDLADPDLSTAQDELRLALELHHARLGQPWPRTPQLRSDAPIVSHLTEAEVRVEVAVRSGADQEALEVARAGITRLRSWQGTTDSIELRSSLAMHGYRMLEQAMVAAVRSGDPATVFEWSERSRGFIAGVAPVRTHRSPRPEEVEMAALRGLLAAGQDDSAELRRLRDRIRRRQWARERASRIGVDIGSFDQTVETLTSQGATLVSFVSDSENVSALIMSGAAARVVPVTSRVGIRSALAGLQAELDMTAAELRPALHQAVLLSLRSRLADLTRQVWGPVEPYVATGRVLITAPAALAAVPWNLLPPLRDRSISVPTSVTQWLRHAGVREPITKVGFIAGPAVARAQLEVEHAAKQWPGATVITGADANTASVRALAGETDLLHVSAHGRHSPGNPMFSGLELLDGPWLGHDVAELTTVPSIVVLSACEVGRSTARWGEETVGLARAWLHAGVRCVIAAPCTVNDAATSDYLGAVHGALASGATPSDALLAAGPDERAPFLAFGAGF